MSALGDVVGDTGSAAVCIDDEAGPWNDSRYFHATPTTTGTGSKHLRPSFRPASARPKTTVKAEWRRGMRATRRMRTRAGRGSVQIRKRSSRSRSCRRRLQKTMRCDGLQANYMRTWSDRGHTQESHYSSYWYNCKGFSEGMQHCQNAGAAALTACRLSVRLATQDVEEQVALALLGAAARLRGADAARHAVVEAVPHPLACDT